MFDRETCSLPKTQLVFTDVFVADMIDVFDRKQTSFTIVHRTVVNPVNKKTIIRHGSMLIKTGDDGRVVNVLVQRTDGVAV